MAGVVHIPEEEAARNLSEVLDRALAGEEVLIRHGEKEVRLVPEPKRYAGRPLKEVLAILEEIDRTEGLTPMDPDFADDMVAIHEEMNRPLDTSKWD